MVSNALQQSGIRTSTAPTPSLRDDCKTEPSLQFRYEPLDANKLQIRLLKIEDGASEPQICCKLQHFELDGDCPRYRAVSYAWGNPALKFEIQVNGQPLRVTKNLGEFLKSAKHHPECKDYLFIDQICIDQKMIAERNRQVNLMKRIFSGAQEVLIWLDPNHEDVAPALTLLQTLRDKPLAQSDKDMISEDPNELLWHFCWQTIGGYFSRVWIVQEVVLAQELTVLCGAERFTWGLLEHLHDVIAASAEDNVLLISAAMALVRTRRELSKSEGIPLSRALAEFGYSECFDRRDRIYGMLGIVQINPRIVELLAVDYSKNRYQLFVDAVLYLVLENRNQWTDGGLSGIASALGFGCNTGHILNSASERIANGDMISREDIVYWICQSTGHSFHTPPCEQHFCWLSESTKVAPESVLDEDLLEAGRILE